MNQRTTPASQASPAPGADPAPRVTVAIANYNGERFLAAAIRSALAQTVQDLEVIVVDDRSTDNSPAIVRALIEEDRRVRLEIMPANGGPAAARNRALELARGDWFAILDGDDLLHPARLERLIDAATRDDADLIADDLLLFDDADAAPPRRFLSGEEPYWVTLPGYMLSGRMFHRGPSLGFLKPVIRRAALLRHGLRYDESLRIAEDDFFVMRMLAAGMRYRIVPQLGYFYRKHGTSISHRLGEAPLLAIAQANKAARAWMPAGDAAADRALAARQTSFARALAYTRAIAALKDRRPLAAVREMAAEPGALPLLRMLGEGAIAKRRRARARPVTGRPGATVIGRGAGSPGRAAALAALRRHGLEPQLVELPATNGWTADDALLIAARARPHAELLIAEDADSAEGLVYALRPEAPMAVIAAGGEERATAHAPAAAAWIACPPAPRQPASPIRCLVETGSSARDAAGLHWLLHAVWPLVLASAPGARLMVAGPAGAVLVGTSLPGVERVDDDAAAIQAADNVRLYPWTVPGAVIRPDEKHRWVATGTTLGRPGGHDDPSAFAAAILGGAPQAPSPLDDWIAAALAGQSAARG